jgi:V/A-type H+-transporting ATPase subunit C
LPFTVIEGKELHRDDERYAYPVARVLTDEKAMFDKAKQEKLLSSRDLEEAIKILGDMGYMTEDDTPKESYLEKSSDYISIIKKQQEKLYKSIKELMPEPELLYILALRNDFHNIKVILKAEFLEKDISEYSDIILETGNFTGKEMIEIITERKILSFGEDIEKALIEAMDTYNRTRDPQTIDIILDKACYKMMHKKVLETRNAFYIDIIRLMIDVLNLKMFLRAKTQEKDISYMNNILLEDGFIRRDRFSVCYEKSYEEISQQLKTSSTGQFLEEAVGEYLKTGRWTGLEKMSDDFLINYIKQAHNMSLGIEPVIGHILGREMELKNIGIILVGIENNISSEIIRDRLRVTYV